MLKQLIPIILGIATVTGCSRNDDVDIGTKARVLVPSAIQMEILRKADPFLTDEELGQFSRDIAFIIYGINPQLTIEAVKPVSDENSGRIVYLSNNGPGYGGFKFRWSRTGVLMSFESIPGE